MRQIGTMTEGDWMQADAATEIQTSGERIKVRRIDATGVTTYFYIYAKQQPFRLKNLDAVEAEARGNLGQNNRRDFVMSGPIAVQELDDFAWKGFQWQVALINELQQNGTDATVHCLCVKQGAAQF